MTIERDCFWFKTGTGYLIYYRKGEGVTVEREPRADPAEEQLWLNGSTYAAIAAINGYVPVHASAVAWRGRAYAFAGPSGAGKSTLAAALGHHGLPLVCDDTMILDTASASQIICLPGHKRLKVKEDTLSLVDPGLAAPWLVRIARFRDLLRAAACALQRADRYRRAAAQIRRIPDRSASAV